MTNFFEELEKIMPNFNCQIGIAKKGEILSVLFQLEPTGENASGKTIPHLLISGTVQELNENFFKTITEPLQLASKSFDNVSEFKKAIEDSEVGEIKPKSKATATVKNKVSGKKVLTADDHLVKGEGFFTEEKFKKALEYFEKALLISKDKKQKEKLKELISTCKVKIVAVRELKGEEEDTPEEEEVDNDESEATEEDSEEDEASDESEEEIVDNATEDEE